MYEKIKNEEEITEIKQCLTLSLCESQSFAVERMQHYVTYSCATTFLQNQNISKMRQLQTIHISI